MLAVLLSGCVTTGGLEHRIIQAKDRVAPALVHIRPVKEVYSQGRREEMLVVGSGFIISPEGYVVTNEHVAGESSVVHVILSDKSEVPAKVVGVDPYTDLAVLKLDVDYPLPFVKLGSSAALETGERVLALGSPHGLARSVSEGIISVTDRHLEDRGAMASPFNNWLQTDAAINPGNSGGPLVNLRGEVVGVNARVLSGAENVGFAIPIDVAKEVVTAIIEKGRVERSTIGLTLQEMQAQTDDPDRPGVLVADIDPLSPASESDIHPGDILVAVNGVPVNARFEEDLPPVQKLMADLPVGQAAELTVERGGEPVAVQVTPEELSQPRGTEQEFEEWAFTVSDLTPQHARRARLAARKGVHVSGVQVGGLASQAGLQQGDIVLSMDKIEIEDLPHFTELYKERVASGQSLVLLFVKRGALTRFALIEQEAKPEPATVAPEPSVQIPPVQQGEPLHVE
ncbi:MAG: trypsin-like peptidase domain-containing protein [Candidatus Hydrogenedentes bacterium]|nr:trypsin-like peptidase domain-containing protein [Candidatus Hydrogenedentota bacterium]